MFKKVVKAVLPSHRIRTGLVLFVAAVTLTGSTYALNMVRQTAVAKPVTPKTPSSHHVTDLKKVTTPPKTTPKPTTTTPPPAPAAISDPTPVTPKPVAAPTPKPTTNPAQSPATIADSGTAPGDGVNGLTSTGGTPVPPPPPADASTPCVGTPVSYASTNWAGYVKQGCNFTAVSGGWTIPTPVSASTTDVSVDAAWIGIGGVTTSDLIQIGTVNMVDTDGTIYTAVFWELLPDDPTYPTNITVTPGDHVTASITETTANQWSMSITNTTTGQSFNKTVSYTSSHTSAEWIEEVPSYASGGLTPFNDFGSITFSGANATGNGTPGTLADASSIKLVNQQHKALATPSAVTGANSDQFTVVRNHP